MFLFVAGRILLLFDAILHCTVPVNLRLVARFTKIGSPSGRTDDGQSIRFHYFNRIECQLVVLSGVVLRFLRNSLRKAIAILVFACVFVLFQINASCFTLQSCFVSYVVLLLPFYFDFFLHLIFKGLIFQFQIAACKHSFL